MRYSFAFAMLGKQIILLQASLALLEGSPSRPPRDSYDRRPFNHPALDGAEILSSGTRSELIDKKNVAELAFQYDLPGVLRWLPKNVCGTLSSAFGDMASNLAQSVAREPRGIRNRGRPQPRHVCDYRRYLFGKGRIGCERDGTGSDIETAGLPDRCTQDVLNTAFHWRLESCLNDYFKAPCINTDRYVFHYFATKSNNYFKAPCINRIRDR